MYFGAPQFFGGYFLSGSRFYQGRAAQKDSALLAYNHYFITHGRYISPSCSGIS
jgi:hypothetical protein